MDISEALVWLGGIIVVLLRMVCTAQIPRDRSTIFDNQFLNRTVYVTLKDLYSMQSTLKGSYIYYYMPNPINSF